MMSILTKQRLVLKRRWTARDEKHASACAESETMQVVPTPHACHTLFGDVKIETSEEPPLHVQGTPVVADSTRTRIKLPTTESTSDQHTASSPSHETPRSSRSTQANNRHPKPHDQSTQSSTNTQPPVAVAAARGSSGVQSHSASASMPPDGATVPDAGTSLLECLSTGQFHGLSRVC